MAQKQMENLKRLVSSGKVVVIERLKSQEYLCAGVNKYFWCTYTKKEMDFVEEREGRLYGYETKWRKAKPYPPKEFLNAYPEASYMVMNHENYLNFIIYQSVIIYFQLLSILNNYFKFFFLTNFLQERYKNMKENIYINLSSLKKDGSSQIHCS